MVALSLDGESDLLQSSFALSGELFRTAFILLLPTTTAPTSSSDVSSSSIIELILTRIAHCISLPGVCVAAVSNAVWATGRVRNSVVVVGRERNRGSSI